MTNFHLKSHGKKMLLAVFLTVFFQGLAFAQSKMVSGKIIEAGTKEPVIGAAVKIKGISRGVSTNIEGQFKIDAPEGAELEISSMGYQKLTVKADFTKPMVITLATDRKNLDEVVVVGYGQQKKSSLTNAITQIGPEVFKDRGINNAGVALQGQVPGLTVTRGSSRPGSEGVAFKIRGDISKNGDNAPLIIIDGVTGSPDEFSQLDPNNIASISVLKDASAAIYGSRSANGVILVTTKRGKGKPQLNYTGTFTNTIDGIKVPLTNQFEWLTMFKEAQINDAKATNTAVNWWIFQNIGGESLINRMMAGEEIDLIDGGKAVHYSPTDLQDFMYGQARSQKHNISYSGGEEKFAYRASLGWADAKSQLKVAPDGEKKWNGMFNADYNPTKAFKIASSISYDKRDVTTPRSGVGGGWNDMYFWPIYNQYGQFYDTFGFRNPVAYLVDGGNAKFGLETFRSNLAATLDLSEYVNGLSVKSEASFKRVIGKNSTLQTPVTVYDWVGKVQAIRDNPGGVNEVLNNWENQTYGSYLNYNRTFNSNHNLSAMIGITSEIQKSKTINARRIGGFLYPGTDLSDINTTIGGANLDVTGGGQWVNGLVSQIGRFNYDYKGKYLVSLLGRRDGSSKLFPEYRWRNFHSISGAWRVSSENFMKSLTFLDNLKLRYSYGKTGSDFGINFYESYAILTASSNIFGNDNNTQPAIFTANMTSPDRTWETITKQDWGVEFAVLKNRLSGSMDWFRNVNDGMFIGIIYPAVLGANAPTTNSGKFSAHGWEMALDWKDKAGSLTYNIGVNLADSKTNIDEQGAMPRAFAGNNFALNDHPLNAVYAHKTDGIFQTQEEVNEYYAKYYFEANGTTMKSGNIIPANNPASTNRLRPGARKLVDVDEDGVITDKDIIYMGDKAPHYSFGIRTGLEWKGFDLNAFFQGVGKQVVLRGGNLFGPFVTNYTQQNKIYMGNTWTPENPNSEYTILSRDQNFNRWNYQNKDISVENSRYIRLKSLIVGYTIPRNLTTRAKIQTLRVFFSGDDLWESTKVKDGYDPEYGENSNNSFPFSRLLSFGVNATF